MCTCEQCCELLFIILLPPVAVLMRRGCDIHFCVNILLTLLGYIPGMLHAIYVCFYFEQ
ncbi:hypothetical protein AB6A40_001660 [Gnathostoma spinigerum]|uniref:Plasma membrane proteolipid 3 n=1 Tax=Gnathostoma spinigerum TaxID=75299 RepID=A0ABD6EC37_9BILA